MALLLFGKSICSLCGLVINTREAVYSFPPFVVNNLDPCFVFSDNSFHNKCITRSSLGFYAIKRAEEWGSKVGRGNRRCVVCNTEVMNPDDYILIEYITQLDNHPLYKFNYTHLHKTCINKWKDRRIFVELIENAIVSGLVSGSYFNQLVSDINSN